MDWFLKWWYHLNPRWLDQHRPRTGRTSEAGVATRGRSLAVRSRRSALSEKQRHKDGGRAPPTWEEGRKRETQTHVHLPVVLRQEGVGHRGFAFRHQRKPHALKPPPLHPLVNLLLCFCGCGRRRRLCWLPRIRAAPGRHQHCIPRGDPLRTPLPAQLGKQTPGSAQARYVRVLTHQPSGGT